MALLATFMLFASVGAFASKGVKYNYSFTIKKSCDLNDIDHKQLNSNPSNFKKKSIIAGYKCFSLSWTAICVYFTYDPTWYEQFQVQMAIQGVLCGGGQGYVPAP